VNYDYKGIYLLEANGSYDGSSRFPAADQWAFFPSFSAGYRFSEEAYFEPLKAWWSNGKIRASYGHIGNEAVGNNMFISTISPVEASKVHWLQNGVKISEAGMPTLVSPTLTWERVITTDVGIDLGFFNNALNVGFDWYQRDTKNMLVPAEGVPVTFGAGAPKGNYGNLRTRGWEIGIGWNHSFGDADVYANFNIYDGKTTVTEYRNDAGLINNFYTGKTYGEIWGFETDRYFEEKDFNGKDEKGNWVPVAGVAVRSAGRIQW